MVAWKVGLLVPDMCHLGKICLLCRQETVVKLRKILMACDIYPLSFALVDYSQCNAFCKIKSTH